MEAAFTDQEDSSLTDEKPPYGVAGWTKKGDRVLLYDRYDIWSFALDGRSHERLTRGAEDSIRHRRVVVAADPDAEQRDVGPPAGFYVSLYGDLTEDSGYGFLKPGRALARRGWEPARISGLVRAEDADVFSFTAERFDHSPDLFAAGVAGAPLTNMMSMSMSSYWNSGQTDAYIFHESQGRMDRPSWSDVDTYIANSPIFSIEDLNTPLLVAFGDDAGAVDWQQGVEMCNAARLAQRPFVMLVYPGENRGLRKKPNQVDYHHRVREWFDTYLTGKEAPRWISDGVPWLDQEKALEEIEKPKGGDKG